jgi:SOS-response transcriptional repressor LexA
MVETPITPVQRETLDFIANHIDKHGYAPSVNDISREFGGLRCQAVVDRLRSLERRGFITRQRYKARSIVLTRLGLEKAGRLSPDRIRTSFVRTRPSQPGQCPVVMPSSAEKENQP